jgi:hypothetical protein
MRLILRLPTASTHTRGGSCTYYNFTLITLGNGVDPGGSKSHLQGRGQAQDLTCGEGRQPKRHAFLRRWLAILTACFRRRHGQRKAKRGSGTIAALRPEMPIMQFNDGTADGQAHTHSVLLGGEKGLEDAIRMLQARTAILHFDADGAGIMQPGAQDQSSPASGDGIHRVHAVDAQIDQDLLNLHPVSQDRRQPRF